MLSILTNNSAMTALQSLTTTQRQLTTTQNQISSGLEVANASDNEAYWSIGQNMSAQVAGLGAVNNGLSLMSSMVAVTDVAVNQIITTMNGIRNDVISAQQAGMNLTTIQQDIAAKQKLIVGIANSASFNGQNWLVQNKTAKITITETHAVQDTAAHIASEQASNVQAAGPIPNGNPPSGLYSSELMTSGSPPAGYIFNDNVDYVATANETDANGISKTETTHFQGTDVDKAYTADGWTSDHGAAATSNPSVHGAQWVPGSEIREDRQSTQPVSSSDYTDTGSVNYSGSQNAIVPSASSQSGDSTAVSVDTTQFTLFTNYTGSVDVTESSTYSDSNGQTVPGSIIFEDRSHSSTTPYTSYDVDNGFEENNGALDTNIGGTDASSKRLQTPEDDLALASKTTVLNFDITDLKSGSLADMQTAIEADLGSLRSMSAVLGGATNRISTMQTYNASLSDALTSGIGSLVDADMNVASTRLQALRTQQQLGIQVLSMANNNSQLILKLFQTA